MQSPGADVEKVVGSIVGGGGRRFVDGAVVLRGKRLLNAYAKLRPLISRAVDGISDKNNDDEHVLATNLADFIKAQWSPHIRDSLRRLTRGRAWQHVTLPEFMRRLWPVAQFMLAEASSSSSSCVVVVVDGIHKSSFWVLMLVVHLLLSSPSSSTFNRLVMDGAFLVVVDNASIDDLGVALSGLPGDAKLAVVDDAVYTGMQLSAFYRRVRLQWRDAVPGTSGKTLVCVPYISTPAVPLFSDKGTLISPHVEFHGLFHRRSAATVLRMDVFFLPGGRRRRRHGVDMWESYLFDFLGLYPDQTVMLFEHKIADAVSIPYRWLHMGPCLSAPDDIRVAYRVRADRAALLAEFLKTDVHQRHFDDDAALLPTMMGRAYAHRVVELMHYRRFREEYMEGPLKQPRHASASTSAYPRFMPILPPSMCDARYRRFMKRQFIEDLRDGSPSSRRILLHMPSCITPPYRQATFHRSLVKAVV